MSILALYETTLLLMVGRRVFQRATVDHSNAGLKPGRLWEPTSADPHAGWCGG